MGINKVQYGSTTLIDLTSDTVTADKLMQGYTAHDRTGALITGTATGGGSVTQDQDGFIVLPPDGGGSPSVGGLEYETGAWTPSEDVYKQTITFTNAHSKPPMFVMMADATETDDQTASTNYGFAYSSFYAYTGQAVPSNETLNSRYALVDFCYRGTGNPSQGTSGITNLTGSTASADEYWVTNTSFIAYTSSNSRYWRAGRTYKWIAVWAPTT